MNAKSAPSKRQRSKRLIWLGGGALLVVIILLVFLPAILSRVFLKGQIVAAVESEVSVPVELDGLGVSWTGAQRLDGFRLGAPAGFPGDDLLAVAAVRVEPGLFGLLFGGEAISVIIDKPVLRVRRDAEGRLNLDRILRSKDGDGEPERAPPEPPDGDGEGDGGGAGRVELPLIEREIRIELLDAEVHYRDDELDTQSVLSVEKALLTAGPDQAALELLVRQDARQADAATDAATDEDASVILSAELRGFGGATDLSALEVRARGGVDGLRLAPYRGLLERYLEPYLDVDVRSRIRFDDRLYVGGFAIDSVEGDARLLDGKLTLSKLVAAVNGGRIEAAGDLVLAESQDTGAKQATERARPFRFTVDLEDVEANYDLSPVLAYVLPFLILEGPQAELSGKIQGRLAVEGAGFSAAEIEKHLRGRGMVRLRDGYFTGSKFFGEVARLLGTEFGKVVVSEMGSDFEIGDGRLLAEKVFLQPGEGSKVRNLGLRGVTGFDGSLDYGVDLASLQETIGDKKISRILRDARKILGQDVAPVKLRGTLDEPRLSLDLGSSALGVDKDDTDDSDDETSIEDAVEGILDLFKRRKKN